MEPAKNLPQAAFFSAEKKVQLLSGNCPRNLTKERLKEWLSFRKGTAKDGSARSEATKAELSQRSGYSYGTRTATCICYSYGSQNVSLDFSVIADSCLSKLLYLPLEGLSDPSECPFFEPD